MKYNFAAFIKQLLGKRNLFGYVRSIINQANLIYWFLGHFYHSKSIFNNFIKSYWVSYNIYAIISLITHSILYIFLTSNPHTLYTLFASEMIVTAIYLLIMTPVGSYLYFDGIMKTFKILDKSYDTELKTEWTLHYNNSQIEPVKRKKYTLHIAFAILLTQISIFSSFMISTYLDLVIDYNTGKLSDPKYSVFPLYCENVDQLSTFLMLFTTQVICGLPLGAMYLSIPFFAFVLMREFYCKFQTLSDFLDHRSRIFAFYYEELIHKKHQSCGEISQLQNDFLKDIHSVAKCHHDLLRGISHLRPYMEYNMSIGLFTILYIEIVLVYIFTLMNEESMLMKFKISCHAAFTATILLMHCLTGKLYSDMRDMFHEVVYNVPWYYLPPSSRKSVYLLLFQAQIAVEFKAFGIYIVNMEFFLRLCNYIYSTVNLLKRKSMGFSL